MHRHGKCRTRFSGNTIKSGFGKLRECDGWQGKQQVGYDFQQWHGLSNDYSSHGFQSAIHGEWNQPSDVHGCGAIRHCHGQRNADRNGDRKRNPFRTG